MIDTVYDILRATNVLLAVIAIVQMIRRRADLASRPTRDQFYGIALFGMTVVGLVGSVETLFTGIPGGLRVWFTTLALAWLTIASLDGARRWLRARLRRIRSWFDKTFPSRPRHTTTKES